MESAIVRSIREQTSLTQLGCWGHLRQDVQRWIAENYPRIHRARYINDLYEILRSKTNAECQKVKDDKKSSWEEGFIKYFERHVETKLEYFCLWSINNKCTFDENNGITTNQSEGFNFLLKDFQNWKEVPLDCLMMSLKLIQGFYSEECRRGKAGLGNFSLKSKYVKFRTPTENFESRHLVCHPKDMVNSIKKYRICKKLQYVPFHCALFHSMCSVFHTMLVHTHAVCSVPFCSVPFHVFRVLDIKYMKCSVPFHSVPFCSVF